jgi:hypothetical protein
MSGHSYSDAEPPPHAGKIAVWPLVIQDVEEIYAPSLLRDRFIAEVRSRNVDGIAKYGTPLQTHNGRNPLVDAFQEAMDLTVYLRQAVEEGHPVLSLYAPARGLALGLLAQLISSERAP